MQKFYNSLEHSDDFIVVMEETENPTSCVKTNVSVFGIFCCTLLL